jgi:hypothetical protein
MGTTGAVTQKDLPCWRLIEDGLVKAAPQDVSLYQPIPLNPILRQFWNQSHKTIFPHR